MTAAVILNCGGRGVWPPCLWALQRSLWVEFLYSFNKPWPGAPFEISLTQAEP